MKDYTEIKVSCIVAEAFNENNHCIVDGEITFLKFDNGKSNISIIVGNVESSIDREAIIKILEFLKS